MDELVNLLNLNPDQAPLNADDPQLQNINFHEPYSVEPNLNPLPNTLGTSPPRPSTSGYQPPPPPQQPLPLQPPQPPPAAPLPPLPKGKRPPGRPPGSGQGVKRISAKKRVSSPTAKNKKRVSVGKGKKRVSPKKRVSKSGGGKGGGCGKKPPGRPRGRVSKTKTRPITIIHPQTGEDFAQMECAFMGDNRQNRDNVKEYRLQYPADAYDRLDGNSSGLFLKSVRT